MGLGLLSLQGDKPMVLPGAIAFTGGDIETPGRRRVTPKIRMDFREAYVWIKPLLRLLRVLTGARRSGGGVR
jgi:hypothetical protein